jgi:hypothetical protein
LDQEIQKGAERPRLFLCGVGLESALNSSEERGWVERFDEKAEMGASVFEELGDAPEECGRWEYCGCIDSLNVSASVGNGHFQRWG